MEEWRATSQWQPCVWYVLAISRVLVPSVDRCGNSRSTPGTAAGLLHRLTVTQIIRCPIRAMKHRRTCHQVDRSRYRSPSHATGLPVTLQVFSSRYRSPSHATGLPVTAQVSLLRNVTSDTVFVFVGKAQAITFKQHAFWTADFWALGSGQHSEFHLEEQRTTKMVL